MEHKGTDMTIRRHRTAGSRAGRSSPPPPRPATHPARSRGLSAGKLRTSLSRLLPLGGRQLGRALLLCIPALLFTGEAAAQRCGPADELGKQLRARYGEEVIRTEVDPSGQRVMQLWVNIETRTWTMVLSTIRPRMSCIIGAGRDYDGPLPEAGESL